MPQPRHAALRLTMKNTTNSPIGCTQNYNLRGEKSRPAIGARLGPSGPASFFFAPSGRYTGERSARERNTEQVVYIATEFATERYGMSRD